MTIWKYSKISQWGILLWKTSKKKEVSFRHYPNFLTFLMSKIWWPSCLNWGKGGVGSSYFRQCLKDNNFFLWCLPLGIHASAFLWVTAWALVFSLSHPMIAGWSNGGGSPATCSPWRLLSSSLLIKWYGECWGKTLPLAKRHKPSLNSSTVLASLASITR